VVSLRDNSTASLVGSTIHAFAFDIFSTLTSNGTVVELNDAALANVANLTVDATGGSGPASWLMFATRRESALQVTSGTYTVGYTDVAAAYFADAAGTSQLTIDGGTYRVLSEDNLIPAKTAIAHASDSATISLRGGSFELPAGESSVHLNAANTSTIYVYGDEFNFPFGPIADLNGTLIGQLLDGNSIDWSFLRDTTAQIVLVPEPYALVLSLSGAMALLGVGAIRRHG
jgi:hypothetical protein